MNGEPLADRQPASLYLTGSEFTANSELLMECCRDLHLTLHPFDRVMYATSRSTCTFCV